MNDVKISLEVLSQERAPKLSTVHTSIPLRSPRRNHRPRAHLTLILKQNSKFIYKCFACAVLPTQVKHSFFKSLVQTSIDMLQGDLSKMYLTERNHALDEEVT